MSEKTKICKLRERERTVFARNREGGDSATKIGNKELHGAIIEFEDLRFLVLIRH